ncbi:MAG: 5-formyltetrahydrofolate cyclo-ligase [Streptosporangiaceae bacterium]|jgi:hypothetical protein
MAAEDSIDLIVCGNAAVNQRGARLGKGAGYSDIEFALLTEAGLVGERTTIVTTVHELQVLEEELPEQDHDFRVDLIVTPERVNRCTWTGPKLKSTFIRTRTRHCSRRASSVRRWPRSWSLRLPDRRSRPAGASDPPPRC